MWSSGSLIFMWRVSLVCIFFWACVCVECTKEIFATCPYTWWQHPQFSSSSLWGRGGSGRVSRRVAAPSFSASFHHHLCPLFPVLPKTRKDQGGPGRDPSFSCGSSSCDGPLLPPLLGYPPLSPVQNRIRKNPKENFLLYKVTYFFCFNICEIKQPLATASQSANRCSPPLFSAENRDQTFSPPPPRMSVAQPRHRLSWSKWAAHLPPSDAVYGEGCVLLRVADPNPYAEGEGETKVWR